MLKRSGHWWNRKRIWYYHDSESSESPKPHTITIILGCMSPLLAIAATAISILSLQTSQQSLKLGQRAYLRVPFGNVEIARDRHGFSRLSVKYEIQNIGNTPANSLRVDIIARCVTLPGFENLVPENNLCVFTPPPNGRYGVPSFEYGLLHGTFPSSPLARQHVRMFPDVWVKRILSRAGKPLSFQSTPHRGYFWPEDSRMFISMVN